VGRFRRLLRHACRAPADLQAMVERLAGELGLRQAPAAWLVPGRLAPMLWAGLRAPRLLLPADLLGRVPAGQLDTLLTHELAHLRRGDHWVRLLEFVVRGLYWWHPVVWYACRELREAEEQCCDAWVVTTLPGSGRTYATALVETLDFLSDRRPPAPLLASGIGHVSDLKRRLRMIMGETTPRALTWAGCLTVLALGGFLLPVLPTWAQERLAAPPPALTPAVNEEKPKEKDGATDALRDQLKKLEDVLQKRLAEVHDTQRMIQDIRAKLQAHGGQRVGIEIDLSGVADRKLGQPVEITFRLIDGRWVQVSPRTEGHRPGTPYYQGVPGTRPVPLPPPPQAGQPGQPALRLPVQPDLRSLTPAVPPPQPPDNRRLDELEKKLHELEKMIRELKKSSKPGSGQETSLLPTKEAVAATEAELQFQAAKLYREGRYVEALRRYQKLSATPGDRNLALSGLAGMIRCYTALKQPDEVRKCVVELRDNLDRLDEPDQKKWRVWLQMIEKGQEPPEAK
jgi:hypothetical protein